MADETPPPPPPPKKENGDHSDEARLLREEVEQQRADAAKRESHEKAVEQLKNRVSVAAIVLTTALSFIGNVKSNRQEAVAGARDAAEAARRQSSELWAYYQTTLAERTSLEMAHDRLHLDLAHRGISREDPSVKLEAMRLSDYERRIRDIDHDTQQVFFRVQELERDEDVKDRQKLEPGQAVFRYDLSGKLITLALILLSVAILSNRKWLFWGGVILGSIGVLVAFDGYLLFF
jgi:hypothetical protein